MQRNQLVTVREAFSWSDIHSLRFVVQVVFSTIILGFSIFQLSTNDGKDTNQAVYWSCISGILALWMPSPASSQTAASVSSAQPTHEPTLDPSVEYRSVTKLPAQPERSPNQADSN
jgi:hypothetical protein